jgi:hypothetical protein
MPFRAEQYPTDRALASGRYELLNVFGTPTGEIVRVREGDRLPASAIGYKWRLVEDPASPPRPANAAHPAQAGLPAAARARCASFNDWLNREQRRLSLSPRCPWPLLAPLRRYDRRGIRDGATLGRGTKWAPVCVPALGSADAGNDGPDGISEASG